MRPKTNALSLVVALVEMGFLSSYELFAILSDNPFFGHDLNNEPAVSPNPVGDRELVVAEK